MKSSKQPIDLDKNWMLYQPEFSPCFSFNILPHSSPSSSTRHNQMVTVFEVLSDGVEKYTVQLTKPQFSEKKLKYPLSGKSQYIMIFTKVLKHILHGSQGAFSVAVILNTLIIRLNSTLIQISETNQYCSIITDWRRQWHPTAVLLPGKSHGWRSLVGCSPWGH